LVVLDFHTGDEVRRYILDTGVRFERTTYTPLQNYAIV